MKSRRKFPSLVCRLILAVVLVGAARGADVTPTNAVAPAGATNSAAEAEIIRNSLQLQEQIHAAQLAIERNRTEAADSAAKNLEALTERFKVFEQSLASQREHELQRLEGANRFMLIVGGSCVAIGFVAMLLTAFLQWRAVSRLTEFSMVSRAALTPGRGSDSVSPATGELNSRLFESLERIERQIHQLENNAVAHSVDSTVMQPETVSATTTIAPLQNAQRIPVLLAKGQSLLDLDQSEQALAVFDEILALNPHHADTLVRKGETLENLRRLDEAVFCYDAAIAADASLTIAYLHKGGLFNRMHRYEEALACYEQALKTQEKATR